MVYRRGERTARHRERDNPHAVFVDPPDTCRGAYVEDCHRWHRATRVDINAGLSQQRNGRELLSFCFAGPEMADAFATAVGGHRARIQYKGNGQRVLQWISAE